VSRPYYTLVELEDSGWSIRFGDYFKSVVRTELEDAVYSGTPRKRLRIIQSGDLQSEIEQAVRQLP
jgi:hypothetical protein